MALVGEETLGREQPRGTARRRRQIETVRRHTDVRTGVVVHMSVVATGGAGHRATRKALGLRILVVSAAGARRGMVGDEACAGA